MEVLKDDFSELQIGTSVESFQKFLDSQKELFHSQIDQLQKVVVTQCKLTGVNPLSQEMAAGALSIKIGKRPRDLLNPKAIKYMQSVFAIKDAISKKESREISALYGVTVTQVREFFNIQRSRVRRLVRLSREKVIRSNASKETTDGALTVSDPMMPIEPVPLNSIAPVSVEEALPSCSTQDADLPGLNELDKHFVDNIFSLMHKEETFSGQEKLMKWVLQIQNSSVLCWFLNRGGMAILATWLSQAAIEEQTSLLLLILKVLYHLPLHKALPLHMSAILQSVNRLRFYKISDISNRARVMLSRWSKMLARNQAMKKPNGMKHPIDAQKEIMIAQSANEIMGAEAWDSSFGNAESIFTLTGKSSENFRKLKSPQGVKLLTACADDSNKKPILGLTSSKNRERRKVQLVEQPGQKTASRSPNAAKATSVSQSRPMSADDIQKAKMRALYMQSKYGKIGLSNESKDAKAEGLCKPSSRQATIMPSLSKVPIHSKIEENKKPLVPSSKVSNRQEESLYFKEPFSEKCRRAQIPWKTPAEMKLNDAWKVGSGENSKEVDVQKNRNRREKETFYKTVQEIPLNPKEPWDLEMDYDDTLTPEIPTEQPPDADSAEMLVSPGQGINNEVPLEATSSGSVNPTSLVEAEPDLELLAVLLKNPELVFALTSGQAGNFSNADTVKLLDMIKKGGLNLAKNLNGVVGKEVDEKVEVSLPSPTPSVPGTSGWRSDAAKNPFSQQNPVADIIAHNPPVVVASSNSVLPQMPAASIILRQQPSNLPVPSVSQPFTVATSELPLLAPSLRPNLINKDPTRQSSSDMILTMKNLTTTNILSRVNLSSAAVPSAMLVEGTLNQPEGLTNSFRHNPLPSSPRPTPTSTVAVVAQSHQHSHFLKQPVFPEPSSHLATVYSSRPKIEKPAGFALGARQDLSSNYHSQLNQNNYNAFIEGSMQPGHSLEQNDYVREEFESWSPEGSPMRNQEYIPGNNFPDASMNFGRNYRPEWPRQRSSAGYWEHNRQGGNRRWRDGRR